MTNDIIHFIYLYSSGVTLGYLINKAYSCFTSSKLERQSKHNISSYNNLGEEKEYIVVIPSWREDEETLEETIDKIKEAGSKSRHNLKIIIVTYPNDEVTLKAVKNIKRKHKDLEVLINETLGPTTKGQNLSYALKKIKNSDFKGYIVVFDAEVRPEKNYFIKLDEILKKTTEFVQTKIIAFPFKSKNIYEDIVGRLYFVSQSYVQWLIDTTRTKSNKSVFLKGAGMIFPAENISSVIDSLTEYGNKKSFIDKLASMAEDGKLSIDLITNNRKILFYDQTYTLEDPPTKLISNIKRNIRWFKANFGLFLKYYKNKKFLKLATPYYLNLFLLKLSPVVYIGYLYNLLSKESIDFATVLFTGFFGLYYLLIPPLIATIEESKIPEIYNKMIKKKTDYLKEYAKNFIANCISILITPLVAIIGYYEILKKKDYWYRTERK